MNFKACTFERLALNSLGFGRGAQVGKTPLLKVNLLRRKRRRWAGRIHFLFGMLQVLGSHQNPRSLEEDDAFFYNAKQRRHTSMKAARCCVTTTLASETF